MNTNSGANSAKANSRTTRLVRKLWFGFLVFLGVLVLLFVLMYNGVIGYMPPIEDLKNPTDKYATIVYTADGVEMGRFYRNSGNRVEVDFDDIPTHLLDALVSTEDERFYEHSGIDFRALWRAIIKRGILRQKSAGGGSTITQQLAKQLYSDVAPNAFVRLLQKPIEWCIAVKLERYYTKDEILKMYLNQFDFLYNAVGIKTASYVYFGKEPNKLTIEESALLVGMLNNPSYYNPRKHEERALARRNTVLDKMVKNGKLTEGEAEMYKAKPIVLQFHQIDHKDGIAPYFRTELSRMLRAKKPVESDYPDWNKQQFITDSYQWENNPLYGWVEKNPKPDGGKWDIFSDGLKIYTTIDSRMQEYAEQAVVEHLSKTLQPAFYREKRGSKSGPYTSNRNELSQASLDNLIKRAMQQTDRYRMMKKAGCSDSEIEQAFNTKTEMRLFSYRGDIDTIMTPRDSVMYTKFFLRAGFMAMEPSTGQVKAYVGGPNFKYFQYDMVSTGRRQVGSTIKPFLYSLAIFNGDTPCSLYPCSLEGLGNWHPRGGGSRAGQMVDLKWALTTSNNWVSAQIIRKFGPEKFVDWLHKYGITTETGPDMTLALGSCDISLKEMVAGYTVFANNGIRTEPLFVTRICDSDGNVISSFTSRQDEVLSSEACMKMQKMMISVVDNGTGRRLHGYGVQAESTGGKTGTTNSNSDGWFMAITPKLVAGAWAGGEERYIHFNNGSIGQGASQALPIYGLFIKKVYADKNLPYYASDRFKFPEGYNPCADEVGAIYGGSDSENYDDNGESFADVFD